MFFFSLFFCSGFPALHRDQLDYMQTSDLAGTLVYLTKWTLGWNKDPVPMSPAFLDTRCQSVKGKEKKKKVATPRQTVAGVVAC